MNITLRNTFRHELSTTLDLGADKDHRVVFIDHWAAMGICEQLFGVFSAGCIAGIDARDEDGQSYLVLLR